MLFFATIKPIGEIFFLFFVLKTSNISVALIIFPDFFYKINKYPSKETVKIKLSIPVGLT